MPVKDFLRSKQGILVILTAGVAVFVLMIWLLFGSSPTQTPPPETPIKISNLNLETINEGVVTFENIEVKGELPNVPPEMEVFFRANTINDQTVEAIGQKFGFVEEVRYLESARLFEWRQSNEQLTLNRDNSSLIYSMDVAPPAKFGTNPTSRLVEIGRNFLEQGGVDSNIKSSGISWLELFVDEAEPVENFTEANVGVVEFDKDLNGYKVYSQNGQPLNETIWVGSDDRVYKASLMTEQIVSSQKTVEVIPVSQVIGLLSQGGGKIVSIVGRRLEENNHFVKLEVESLEVGYFWDPKVTILQPIFVVKGRGYGVNDTTGADLVIYVEAIKK